MPTTTLEIPHLRALFRHALPRVVEGTLVPLALFYGAMTLLGVWGGLVAALVWSYGAIAARVVSGRPVPGVLVLGALALSVRTVVAAASGSTFVYFLQPSLGTVATAAAFLLSVPAGRPLAEKLAADFCPLPSFLCEHPRARQIFVRISVLWGFAFMANAALTIWLLVSQSLTTFLLARTVVSMGLTALAVAASTAWFVRHMRAHGIEVRRTASLHPAVVPAR